MRRYRLYTRATPLRPLEMSRLLNRIARRRAQPGEEPTAQAPEAPGCRAAEHRRAGEEPGLRGVAERGRAGEEPGLRGAAQRGRARRRLRYLRQLRELQLRDLGGFVLDLYRFGEQRDPLVRDKLDRIIATDKETHALEALLGEGRPGAERTLEIRAPGVGGACPGCGELHASDARFCARCGIDLAAAATVRAAQPAPPPPADLAPPGHSDPAPGWEEPLAPEAGARTGAADAEEEVAAEHEVAPDHTEAVEAAVGEGNEVAPDHAEAVEAAAGEGDEVAPDDAEAVKAAAGEGDEIAPDYAEAVAAAAGEGHEVAPDPAEAVEAAAGEASEEEAAAGDAPAPPVPRPPEPAADAGGDWPVPDESADETVQLAGGRRRAKSSR